MRAASDIVGFVLFAGLLATCISPLAESLVHHGLTRSLALLLTILVVLVGGLALAAVLGASVVRLGQALPTYQVRLEDVMASLQSILDRFGLQAGEFLTREVLNPQRVITLAAVLLGRILNVARIALFLLLFVALMVVELVGYEAQVDGASNGMAARLFEVRRDIRTFVSIRSRTC